MGIKRTECHQKPGMSLSLYLELNRRNIFSLSSSKWNTDEENWTWPRPTLSPRRWRPASQNAGPKNGPETKLTNVGNFTSKKASDADSDLKLILNSESASKRKYGSRFQTQLSQKHRNINELGTGKRFSYLGSIIGFRDFYLKGI